MKIFLVGVAVMCGVQLGYAQGVLDGTLPQVPDLTESGSGVQSGDVIPSTEGIPPGITLSEGNGSVPPRKTTRLSVEHYLKSRYFGRKVPIYGDKTGFIGNGTAVNLRKEEAVFYFLVKMAKTGRFVEAAVHFLDSGLPYLDKRFEATRSEGQKHVLDSEQKLTGMLMPLITQGASSDVSPLSASLPQNQTSSVGVSLGKGERLWVHSVGGEAEEALISVENGRLVVINSGGDGGRLVAIKFVEVLHDDK